MHDFSVATGLVDLVTKNAAQSGATKVVSATVVIGVCSCITPDILRDYYRLLTDGTIAEGSELIIRRKKGVATCCDCGRTSELPDFRLKCPVCGSRHVHLDSGTECYLDSLEIEEADNGA